MNSHFIPRLLLRHFSSREGRISLYDLKEKQLTLDAKIEGAFSIPDFYPDDIEKQFNVNIEGAFADLLNHVVLNANEAKVELTRVQANRIKKFLLLLILRSLLQDEWLEKEMEFPEVSRQLLGEEADHLFPFKEKKIEGETPRQYWLRSLRCILDSKNGLPEEIGRNPEATQMAWRWACAIKTGYLGFWSSRKTDVDFLVTDVGMTSENETAIRPDVVANPAKMQALINCSEVVTGALYKQQFFSLAYGQLFLHENFLEFPISKDLMIVLINPYFKTYALNKGVGLPFVEFGKLSKISDESAFSPNVAMPVKEGVQSDEDLYIYDIHDLSEKDCIYLNLLTLDRVDTTLGFGDPSCIISSLASYQCVTGRLNDYSELLSQIQRRRANV